MQFLGVKMNRINISRKFTVLLSVILILLVILILSACGGGGGENSSAPISISGAVQKGPFIIGTPVLVNKLDKYGNPSESTVITEIEDSIGSFSFKIDGNAPVQIISNGYYFSELTGQISSGTLTLKAIYNASDENQQVAYVNILTHLINNRVLKLIRTGEVELSIAISQAQSELISSLSNVLPIDNIPNFSALSVYNINPDNSVGNAYLLALSTAFYKYAETKAYGQNTSADAQLSLILNQISTDFGDDGLIQQTGFIDDLTSALRKLNPLEITENLTQRSLIDFSEPLNIPDITGFFGLCAGAADCMWSAHAPMPVPTRGHASAVHQNKIYIFGGTTPNDYANEYDIDPVSTAFTGVYEYDPTTNQWSQKQAMPVGLYDLTAHTVGNKIYVFGGYGDGGFINSVMEFDPVNNQWAMKTPMPTYRYIFMSEAINGKVYVLGGQGTIDNGPWESGKPWEYKSHVEIYDPATDTWTTGTSAPSNVASGASCSIIDEIYVLGGSTSSTSETNTYVYNTTDDSWTAKSPASVARNGHTCVSIGSNFYLMGGRNSQGTLDTFEIYSTEMDSWQETSFLPTARHWFSANSIDSKIYIFGGAVEGSSTLLNSVEEIDTSMIQ